MRVLLSEHKLLIPVAVAKETNAPYSYSGRLQICIAVNSALFSQRADAIIPAFNKE
jgi:hypothetical protein